MQVANKHRFSISHIMRGMQIKTPIIVEWLKSRTLTTSNANEDVEQQGLSLIAGENVKCYSNIKTQFGGFLQN